MNKGLRELERMLRNYPGFRVEFGTRKAAVVAPGGARMQIGSGATKSLHPDTIRKVERWARQRSGLQT